MESSVECLQVIICCTCGGGRLAIASPDGVDAAKTAIWAMPRHREHYLVVDAVAGDGYKREVLESAGHYLIFPHVLHTHRNRG